jgi:hypothetical protein
MQVNKEPHVRDNTYLTEPELLPPCDWPVEGTFVAKLVGERVLKPTLSSDGMIKQRMIE